MNRDAVIQAAYFACIAVGTEPTYRNVNDMVEKIRGKGYRNGDVCAWLASRRGAKREQVGSKPGADIHRETTKPGAAPERAGVLHAGGAKVLGLEAGDSPSTTSRESPKAPPALFEPEVMEPARAVKKHREQAPTTVAGYAIRDRLGRLVAPYLRAMTVGHWKKINSRDAEEMAKAGRTPEEAEQAWKDCYARTGKPLLYVRDVAKYIQGQAARASPNNFGTARGPQTDAIMAAQARRRGVPADDNQRQD